MNLEQEFRVQPKRSDTERILDEIEKEAYKLISGVCVGLRSLVGVTSQPPNPQVFDGPNQGPGDLKASEEELLRVHVSFAVARLTDLTMTQVTSRQQRERH